jgi:hypothetical protein
MNSSALDSMRTLSVRAAIAVGRMVALALVLGLFIGVPVFAIMEGRWITFVLWALLLVLIWLTNGAAPRGLSVR